MALTIQLNQANEFGQVYLYSTYNLHDWKWIGVPLLQNSRHSKQSPKLAFLSACLSLLQNQLLQILAVCVVIL
jgi:hypothetical protein